MSELELEFIFPIDASACIEELSAQYKKFTIYGCIEETTKVEEEFKTEKSYGNVVGKSSFEFDSN